MFNITEKRNNDTRTLEVIKFDLLGINRCQAFNGIQPEDKEVATIMGLTIT